MPAVAWTSAAHGSKTSLGWIASTASDMAGTSRLVRLRCWETAFFNLEDVRDDAEVLTPDELQSAQRLLHAEDRRDYIAAHALLRRTLSEMVPDTEPSMWRFERTDRGKPFISGANTGVGGLPFSLSHTRDLVACAVGRAGNLGIDVERNATFDIGDLSRTVCSPRERAQLDAKAEPDRTNAFLDLWTLKEACLKARGLGIVEDLTSFSFELRTDGSIASDLPWRDAARWSFVILRPTPDSRVALAVELDGQAELELDAVLIDRNGVSNIS